MMFGVPTAAHSGTLPVQADVCWQMLLSDHINLLDHILRTPSLVAETFEDQADQILTPSAGPSIEKTCSPWLSVALLAEEP